VPAIAVAQVVEHAREHLQAMLTGHGHAHEHGQVPHHEHEEDGSPIRADQSGGMLRVAPPTTTRILIQLTQPALFADAFAEAPLVPKAPNGCLKINEHIPPPWVPSPGDTLPLLI